ncbi:hypothetical protein ACQKEU_11425, partial [Acidovorax sp. NPDC077664]
TKKSRQGRLFLRARSASYLTCLPIRPASSNTDWVASVQTGAYRDWVQTQYAAQEPAAVADASA